MNDSDKDADIVASCFNCGKFVLPNRDFCSEKCAEEYVEEKLDEEDNEESLG